MELVSDGILMWLKYGLLLLCTVRMQLASIQAALYECMRYVIPLLQCVMITVYLCMRLSTHVHVLRSTISRKTSTYSCARALLHMYVSVSCCAIAL